MILSIVRGEKEKKKKKKGKERKKERKKKNLKIDDAYDNNKNAKYVLCASETTFEMLNRLNAFYDFNIARILSRAFNIKKKENNVAKT